jgi:hypothetical protein
MDKIPEEVLSAQINAEIPIKGGVLSIDDDTLAEIEEFKKKRNTAGVAVKGLSTIEDVDAIVNISAEVIRKLGRATDTNPQGEDQEMSKVFVKDENHRSSIFLWGDHAEIEMNKGDTVVVLNARSFLASNENIQFHAASQATVLVNPTDADLDANTEGFELYVSKAWKRPGGKPVEFQVAPSGRAACGYCEKKIEMGDLKIVKPDFIELPTGRTIAGNVSFHLGCVLNDEHGLEVVKEGVTRLTPTLIDDSREVLSEFADTLPDGDPKDIILKLL